MWFVAFAAIQAYASIMQSQQQAAMMREQAKIAETTGTINREASEFEAKMQREAGIEQATFIRRQSARRVGSMVSKATSSGVDLAGSPLLTINDEIWQAERAAGTTISNARAAATSTEGRGRAAEVSGAATASALDSQANSAIQAGWMNAVAAGVRGAAGYYGMSGGGARPIDYGSPQSTVSTTGVGDSWGY